MLRIIETFNNLPQCYEVDDSDRFEPGQIGSLKIKNRKAVIGICDGVNPLGIIDDIKSSKIRHTVWNEPVILLNPKTGFNSSIRKKVLDEDFSFKLKNANIIASSFASFSVPVQLKAKEGVIIVPKGTIFTDDSMISFSVRYSFNTSTKKIEDSTAGSGQCAVWIKNMIVKTDMFDTTVEYFNYKPLYVTNGLLTTSCLVYGCKCVGVVLKAPVYENPFLEFLFDPEGNVAVAP